MVIKCIKFREILTFASQDIGHRANRGHILKFHWLITWLINGLMNQNYFYTFISIWSVNDVHQISRKSETNSLG